MIYSDSCPECSSEINTSTKRNYLSFSCDLYPMFYDRKLIEIGKQLHNFCFLKQTQNIFQTNWNIFFRPSFVILASDGLWDTFSNEEAVAYIKDHLHEHDFGAKSLTLQSYYRGSVDNITVIIISFKNGAYRVSSAATTPPVTNDKNLVSSK